MSIEKRKEEIKAFIRAHEATMQKGFAPGKKTALAYIKTAQQLLEAIEVIELLTSAGHHEDCMDANESEEYGTDSDCECGHKSGKDFLDSISGPGVK